VFALLVLEVVVDAFLLHQAADEVEVAFAVLHAVVAGGVGGRELVGKIRRVLFKDLLDDLGHRFALEHAAIVRAREQPQPGADDQVVLVEAAHKAHLAEARDDAAELADAVIGQFQLDGDGLAQQSVDSDGFVGGQRADVELEQLPERLGG
jgi:hypothetical protein